MECIVNMPFVIRVMVFVYLLTHNYALRRNFSESNTARIVQLLEDGQNGRLVPGCNTLRYFSKRRFAHLETFLGDN